MANLDKIATNRRVIHLMHCIKHRVTSKNTAHLYKKLLYITCNSFEQIHTTVVGNNKLHQQLCINNNKDKLLIIITTKELLANTDNPKAHDRSIIETLYYRTIKYLNKCQRV